MGMENNKYVSKTWDTLTYTGMQKTHIDGQINKTSCNTLTSKTSPVYQTDYKSGLGVAVESTNHMNIINAYNIHPRQTNQH